MRRSKLYCTIGQGTTIREKIKQAGATAAFTMALLNTGHESRFVQGTGVYAPPMYSYFRSFGNYYQRVNAVVSSPGYYIEDEVYYLESNLFNLQNEQLVWSAQSESYAPTGLKSFSKNFSKAMIQQLEKDGILKK